jgi:hypothetical protein
VPAQKFCGEYGARLEFGTEHAVTRTPLQGDGTVVYYVHAGDKLLARAVVQVFKGCISYVLIYKSTVAVGSDLVSTA